MNLQILCNPQQISNGILHRSRKKSENSNGDREDHEYPKKSSEERTFLEIL